MSDFFLYYFEDGPQAGRYRTLEDVTELVVDSPGEATVTYRWTGDKLDNDTRIMREVVPN